MKIASLRLDRTCIDTKFLTLIDIEIEDLIDNKIL